VTRGIRVAQIDRLGHSLERAEEGVLRLFEEPFDLAGCTGSKRDERCEDQSDDDEREQIDLITFSVVLAAHLIDRVVDRKDVRSLAAADEGRVLCARVRSRLHDLEFIERERVHDVFRIRRCDARIDRCAASDSIAF